MEGTEHRDPRDCVKCSEAAQGRQARDEDSDPEQALRDLGRLEDERYPEGLGVVVAIVLLTAAVVAAALWLGIASLRL